MKKEQYTTPEVQIIEIENEDAILALSSNALFDDFGYDGEI